MQLWSIFTFVGTMCHHSFSFFSKKDHHVCPESTYFEPLATVRLANDDEQRSYTKPVEPELVKVDFEKVYMDVVENVQHNVMIVLY